MGLFLTYCVYLPYDMYWDSVTIPNSKVRGAKEALKEKGFKVKKSVKADGYFDETNPEVDLVREGDKYTEEVQFKYRRGSWKSGPAATVNILLNDDVVKDNKGVNGGRAQTFWKWSYRRGERSFLGLYEDYKEEALEGRKDYSDIDRNSVAEQLHEIVGQEKLNEITAKELEECETAVKDGKTVHKVPYSFESDLIEIEGTEDLEPDEFLALLAKKSDCKALLDEETAYDGV